MSKNFDSDNGKQILHSFVSATSKFTQIGKQWANQAADVLGLKDGVEVAHKFAERSGTAVNKAKRMTARALDFEDDDDSIDTLDFEILLSAAGATQKTLIPLSSHSQIYRVPAGSSMVWKARVKKFDIGFSVKENVDNENSKEMESLQKFKSDTQIQGQLGPEDRNRSILLTFDNSYTIHQRKEIAFWISIGEKVSLSDDLFGAARSKEIIAAEEGPSE